MAQATSTTNGTTHGLPPKRTGRAFYESIGKPKMIVAPMVDRSEFAWRVLTRSYLDEEGSKSLLAYTPMMHARLFSGAPKFRDHQFQPTRAGLESKQKSVSPAWLDGNPTIDRPLFVQFCANKPDELLDAAQYVAPYCDAVDLNLGCPQGIARAGHYGAFLQEDWDLIYKLINKLHNELSVPVTAKMRILETKEKTLDYAKMILSAGASILTVHGRRREQKGHNTGVADWAMIRYLRDNLPPETVLFANGNILNAGDLESCLAATGVDGIMSAEGNLSDPTIFAKPPKEHSPREYWYGADGRSGYRIDAVFRRYLDIIYKYSLERDLPQRNPLYTVGDETKPDFSHVLSPEDLQSSQLNEPKRSSKKRKREEKNGRAQSDPSLKFMQGHLFQLLRPMLSSHTHIRDALAKIRPGDMDGFERILAMVEQAIANGMDEYQQEQQQPDSATSLSTNDTNSSQAVPTSNGETSLPLTEAPSSTTEQAQHPLEPHALNSQPTDPSEPPKPQSHPQPENPSSTPSSDSSPEMTATAKVVAIYKRPWWVCQPHIRPLPEDAVKLGALTLKKKDQVKGLSGDKNLSSADSLNGEIDQSTNDGGIQRTDNDCLRTEGTAAHNSGPATGSQAPSSPPPPNDVPQAALVCG